MRNFNDALKPKQSPKPKIMRDAGLDTVRRARACGAAAALAHVAGSAGPLLRQHAPSLLDLSALLPRDAHDTVM